MSAPILLSEDDLDRRFKTKKLLESGGDYGCGCALFAAALRVVQEELEHARISIRMLPDELTDLPACDEPLRHPVLQ